MSLNAGIASFGLCKTTAQIWAEMKAKGNRSAIMRQLMTVWAIQEGSNLAPIKHTGAVQVWMAEGMSQARCNPFMVNRCPLCWPHSEYVKVRPARADEMKEGNNQNAAGAFVYDTAED